MSKDPRRDLYDKTPSRSGWWLRRNDDAEGVLWLIRPNDTAWLLRQDGYYGHLAGPVSKDDLPRRRWLSLEVLARMDNNHNNRIRRYVAARLRKRQITEPMPDWQRKAIAAAMEPETDEEILEEELATDEADVDVAGLDEALALTTRDDPISDLMCVRPAAKGWWLRGERIWLVCSDDTAWLMRQDQYFGHLAGPVSVGKLPLGSWLSLRLVMEMDDRRNRAIARSVNRLLRESPISRMEPERYRAFRAACGYLPDKEVLRSALWL